MHKDDGCSDSCADAVHCTFVGGAFILRLSLTIGKFDTGNFNASRKYTPARDLKRYTYRSYIADFIVNGV